LSQTDKNNTGSNIILISQGSAIMA
jgi:hypothetical protein